MAVHACVLNLSAAVICPAGVTLSRMSVKTGKTILHRNSVSLIICTYTCEISILQTQDRTENRHLFTLQTYLEKKKESFRQIDPKKKRCLFVISIEWCNMHLKGDNCETKLLWYTWISKHKIFMDKAAQYCDESCTCFRITTHSDFTQLFRLFQW